jgi:cardiolipin synthase A/B
VKLELLVDAREFWPRAREDIRTAQDSVLVQTLSLEGDSAGQSLAEALLRSGAGDRRVIADRFWEVMVSDRFRYAPAAALDRALRREIRDTRILHRSLREGGVGLHLTQPVGPLLLRFPARNHKKLVLVDDRIAYVGGINFSDHNFAWHDLMLRVESAAVGELFRRDFDASWAGRAVAAGGGFGGLEVALLDGRSNEAMFAPLLDAIVRARSTLWLETPYVTAPFMERLAAAAERGVEVTLVTPGSNNWGVVGAYVRAVAASSGIRVRLYPGMTHLKAMLIDGEALVLGSSNFDYFSYTLHHETVVTVTDPDLIADFTRRVREPDHAASVPVAPGPVGWRARAGAWQVDVLAPLVAGVVRRLPSGERGHSG